MLDEMFPKHSLPQADFVITVRNEMKEIIVRQCSVCGRCINYVPAAIIENLRETKVCDGCWAIYRVIDVASAILEVMGLENIASSLLECYGELAKMQIYEIAHTGAIHQILSSSPNFVFSEYFDDAPPGTIHESGVPCEDVQNLSFGEGRFDIIISQDVLEHVPDPIQGLREIYRVLKLGGYHIFTVPFNRTMAKSVTRAHLEFGALRYILPPVYHGDPIRKEGALVYTDFGQDFQSMLEKIGFQVLLRETLREQFRGGYNVVFITRKKSGLARQILCYILKLCRIFRHSARKMVWKLSDRRKSS
jgi:O-antigen biosynthesis protein